VRHVDGHDLAQLTSALATPLAAGRPGVVLARTIKGRGVSFMEDNPRWHHAVPSDEEFARALQELDAAIAALEGTPA
jgi:transketolase